MQMPSGTHQFEVQLPIDLIWNFIKEMDNWAPLVPGYITHTKLNDHQSTWEFYSETGLVSKHMNLLVDIQDWVEPTLVSFQLKGDKYNGRGRFQAESVGERTTKITGYLEINAIGTMASMKNTVLKSVIPKKTEEMAKAISMTLLENVR